MVQKGQPTDLTIEWVGLGRCWEGDSESEGSPERGMSGCFGVWEGFVEGALQLGFKEDRKRKWRGSTSQAGADLCLGGLWAVSS